MKNRIALFCILFLALAQLALAQGTYTQIDYPGALDTGCGGINSSGSVVGNAIIAYGQPEQGFVWNGGVFTDLSYNGESLLPSGINDNGQIVGYSFESGRPSIIGIIDDLSTGTFTRVQYPGHTTEATAINNDGVVVGRYNQNPDFRWEGFELVGSTYTASRRRKLSTTTPT